MDRLALLCILLLTLAGCDLSEQDMVAPVATESEIRDFDEVAELDPVRVDPCDYTDDPGFILTPERVFVPDLCISLISNVDGCWFSDYDDRAELPNAPELEIWCDFDCNGEGLEVGRTTASFPAPDEPAEHYSIANPCPEAAE